MPSLNGLTGTRVRDNRNWRRRRPKQCFRGSAQNLVAGGVAVVVVDDSTVKRSLLSE